MRCCSNPDNAMITGISRTGSVPMWKSRSGADRSCIQAMKGAWRSSIALKSTEYNATKSGICTSIGRQPPAGLMRCSL